MILENINIDIDKKTLESESIGRFWKIDINMEILRNINIDIGLILNRLEFGESKRARWW